MAFDFVCPFCHSRKRVEDRYRGQTGPCSECGRQVTLPYPAPQQNTDSAHNGLDNTYKDAPNPNAGLSELKLDASWISSSSFRYSLLAVMLLLAIGAAGRLVVPAAQKIFEERRRLNTISNIEQIAKALNAYKNDFDTYPTPTVTSKDGNALYSWRVLLLPYLGYKDLYDRFQLDQPWDSPSNVLLVKDMPPLFVAFGNQTALRMFESNFSLVVGPGTLFVNPRATQVEEVTDDPSDTILVVEVKENGINWTQPGDLDNSKGVKIGPMAANDIGGNFTGFVVVATVDGKGLTISSQTPSATIQAMLSPAGGEIVELDR